MVLPKEIKEKLRECPFDIQVFVKALQAENIKQATKCANLISQNISLKAKISGLRKHIKIQAKEINDLTAKTATLRVIYDDHETPH